MADFHPAGWNIWPWSRWLVVNSLGSQWYSEMKRIVASLVIDANHSSTFSHFLHSSHGIEGWGRVVQLKWLLMGLIAPSVVQGRSISWPPPCSRPFYTAALTLPPAFLFPGSVFLPEGSFLNKRGRGEREGEREEEVNTTVATGWSPAPCACHAGPSRFVPRASPRPPPTPALWVQNRTASSAQSPRVTLTRVPCFCSLESPSHFCFYFFKLCTDGHLLGLVPGFRCKVSLTPEVSPRLKPISVAQFFQPANKVLFTPSTGAQHIRPSTHTWAR